MTLEGLNIFVTKLPPAGPILCEKIASHGGHAIYQPSIVIHPMNTFVTNLDADWLIFNSPQAVKYGYDKVKRGLSEHTRFAAVGASTAALLHDKGERVDVVPEDERSEGLLDLDVFKHVEGLKVGIVRGEGGRLLLDRQLAERGARVIPVIVYRREPAKKRDEYDELVKNGKIDAIICGSFDSVRFLKDLFGESKWLDILKIPIIVMSDRIKNLASLLGFQTIWVANKDYLIIDCLLKIRKQS